MNKILKEKRLFPVTVEEVIEADGSSVVFTGCDWHVAEELTNPTVRLDIPS